MYTTSQKFKLTPRLMGNILIIQVFRNQFWLNSFIFKEKSNVVN